MTLLQVSKIHDDISKSMAARGWGQFFICLYRKSQQSSNAYSCQWHQCISGERYRPILGLLSYITLCKTYKPRGTAIFCPGVIIWTNLGEDRYVMLQTQYERFRLSGFREEDFLRFSYEILISPRVWPFLTRGSYLNKLCRGPLGDKTYQISKL